MPINALQPLAFFVAVSCLVGLATLIGLREVKSIYAVPHGGLSAYLGVDGVPTNIPSAVQVPGYLVCKKEMIQKLTDAEFNDEKYTAVLKECINLLKAAARLVPANGDIWFELANLYMLKYGLNEITEMYISLSYRVAPSELWISKRRIPLLAEIQENLTVDIKTNLNQEVVSIIRSWDGINSMAEIYLSGSSNSQIYILEIIKKEDQMLQRRFLSAVRTNVR